MPRFKRHQILYLLAGLALLYMLYSFISTSDGDMPLRKSTEEALSRVAKQPADDVQVANSFPTTSAQELKQGTTQYGAPLKDEDKAPQVESTSVAGRVMMPKPAAPSSKEAMNKPTYPIKGLGSEDLMSSEQKAQVNDAAPENPARRRAKEELDLILKKSPTIIFSKSYCPYSRAAKSLLLDTYTILPTPHVVELDHLTTELPAGSDAEPVTLGKELQNILAELTGRKTVPNVLITARSIGGSDDIAQLDREGLLATKIQELGGKRITKVERNEPLKEQLHVKKSIEGEKLVPIEKRLRMKRGRGM